MHNGMFWRNLRRLCISVAWILLLSVIPFSSGLPARTEAVDVTGAWDLTVESQEGTAHPSITLKQEGERITGTYEGKIGGSLEGTIKGNEISFSLNLKFQDTSYTVTYTGTVTENSMKGTVRFGNTGTGSWSANRKKSLA
jgi:hypothetical protein